MGRIRGGMTGACGGTTLGTGCTLGSGGVTTGGVIDWRGMVGLGIGGGIVARFKICATCTYALQIAEPYSREGVSEGLVLRISTMSVAA